MGKASAMFYNEGDSIELLVSEKQSGREQFSLKYSLNDAVYLHFKIAGGAWWKTSRVIK
jgi:hypothetical protein